jgi:5-formyltetrahydrofolate cyclo-ligase
LPQDDGHEKKRLRQALLASLRLLSVEESESAGRLAIRWLLAWDGFTRASEIVAFSSLRGELDMGPFASAVYSAGKPLLMPRIVGDELEFAPIAAGEELVRGRFGVSEPGPHCVARRVQAGAIVLVPGVAFDVAGGRMGRGAGYYDRALADMRRNSNEMTFLGVGFSLQVIDRVPMTRDDVPMDGVLTPEALVWVEGGRADGQDRVLKIEC